MARLLDIDLLLPKIIKFQTNCNDKRLFSINQVLWMLEQEFALQNGTTNNTYLNHSDNDRCECAEITDDILQKCGVKICDCRSELSDIKRS